jgi:hypothetical protein
LTDANAAAGARRRFPSLLKGTKMSDKKPDKAKQVTPKGAVEVDEKDLDQAAGGVLIGLNQPSENISINYGKIETNLQKPTYDLSSGGPHVAPVKKL